MKEDILFKGKMKGTGEWVQSHSIIQVQGKIYFALFCGGSILSIENALVEIIPDSVGRFIGSKDSEGNKVFEGDILEVNGSKHHFIIEHKNDDHSCGCCGFVYGWYVGENDLDYAKIISNIHE